MKTKPTSSQAKTAAKILNATRLRMGNHTSPAFWAEADGGELLIGTAGNPGKVVATTWLAAKEYIRGISK